LYKKLSKKKKKRAKKEKKKKEKIIKVLVSILNYVALTLLSFGLIFLEA